MKYSQKRSKREREIDREEERYTEIWRPALFCFKSDTLAKLPKIKRVGRNSEVK